MCSFDSTEREHERLRTPIEKLDFEQMIDDGILLPDQPLHPLLDEEAGPPSVDVASACSIRRLPIDNHPEPYGSLTSRRAHHEMDIAGVELARNPPVGLVQNDGLRPHRSLPLSRRESQPAVCRSACPHASFQHVAPL